MKVRKLRSLQNISQTLDGDGMHDNTQNQERDKAKKHAQGNGKGGSLKAYTKMMNESSKLRSLQNISQTLKGDAMYGETQIRKEIKLKSMLMDMEEVRA